MAMRKDSRIFIVGHNDSVENSLKGHFKAHSFRNVLSNTHDNVNVLDSRQVNDFFKKFKPEYVFLGSLRAGGIGANIQFPAQFMYNNTLSQTLVIEASWRWGVKKLLYFSSSCVYPIEAKQPLKETSLMTGPIESTSDCYATGKIAGIKMCQAFKKQYGFNATVIVPATLFGPGSDTDMEAAHVVGALMARFHKAKREGQKEVVVWGSGRARREFLYSEDFVDACILLMEDNGGFDMFNLGYGYDVSIKLLAQMIKTTTGFKGKIVFDTSKPEGAFRKLFNVSRIRKLGWKPKVSLEQGLENMYQWYIRQ